jgi:hypothetical protein
MRKTLEALYFGNLHPTETSAHKKSRYWQVSKQANEAYDRVRETLSIEQQSLFDNFVTLQLSTQSEAELEAFILGYRIGTRLIIDSLTDGDFTNAVTIGGG